MSLSIFRTLAAGAIALFISACGGGGDGGIGGTGGGGGGTAADVSVGTITAFGSVWVNGVEFKSNTATIKIDDNPHPESDLRVGMVARVDGSISGASASHDHREQRGQGLRRIGQRQPDGRDGPDGHQRRRHHDQ